MFYFFLDYSFHMNLTQFNEKIAKEIPALRSMGIQTLKVFTAYNNVLRLDDGGIFKAMQIAKDNGFELIRQNEVLGGLLVPPGILTGKLTPDMQENITMGLTVAQQMSTCDIGQTIVLKDKMVLAVEAIEGTDEALLYAFGVHINPEAPSLNVSSILNHLRAFLLLSDWFHEIMEIDLVRRLSPYINTFPRSYAKKILVPQYRPDLDQCISFSSDRISLDRRQE